MSEHLKSITWFIWSGGSLAMSQVTAFLGEISPDGMMSPAENYIKEGGTALSIFLLIGAVVHLVRENKAYGNRIQFLHEKQIEATEKSTEARIGQNIATENTNTVTKRLADAVDKLAEKIK